MLHFGVHRADRLQIDSPHMASNLEKLYKERPVGGKEETEQVGYKRHPEKAAYVEKTPSIRFFFLLFAYVGTILHDFVF